MATQFPALATQLGFTPADAAAWAADCACAAFALDGLGTSVALFAQAVTGCVNTLVNGPADAALALPAAPAWPPADLPPAVAPGIDGRRQRFVARIKGSLKYTPAVIGKLLRTEGTGTAVNPQTALGRIRSLHLDPQRRVVVAFSKLDGAVDGVHLYLQRDGDPAPGVSVGTFNHTPAVDPTPLKTPGVPETRTYTVINVLHDQEVGVRSPGMSIVVS